jgi:hypothetical protein
LLKNYSDFPSFYDLMVLAKPYTRKLLFLKGRKIMEIELESESDLAKAYQGRYEGVNANLERISNEVKARIG